ncbi:hypothetical protein Poli38472_013129 [Pythium oligandrum]|uniref:BZIP domain-containing protein n=1 Tax=Pythium oligandrum TaxID=41045 RepID=A0A8K1C2M0_PYTOL|nr:hypothetical protein Poli38472_013129 [Pythium oligandrum]|eukprot:TMW55238.1 hypothetical protein Poli38472_013129 [Pythium oligandrum]
MQSPEHVEKRQNGPVIDPVAEEERKSRMRVHARRSYYRKLNLVQELRGQVEKLEAEYADLVHQVQLQEACAFVTEPDEETSPEAPENESITTMYSGLMNMKKRFRQENEALKQALDEHQRYERLIRLDMPESSSESEQSDDSTSTRSTQEPLIVIPSFLMPITLAFCHELGRQTFDDVTRFRQNPDFMTTGASIFGWRDRSVLQGNLLHFLLKKTYGHVSADELAARSWDFFSKPKSHEIICPASMNPRVFQIQRVEFLFLVSFLKTPEGHLIILRAIKHDLLNPYNNPPGVFEQWMDNYYGWITSERAPGDDEACEMNYGGILPLTTAARSTALMMETLFITMRSESHIIGLNLVTSS